MEAYMFGNYPATKYGWDYDVLKRTRKDRYFVYHHLDRIQPGDVGVVYSFEHEAFVAVTKITSHPYLDGEDLFVDWDLHKLPPAQWIRRSVLQHLKPWRRRKPFVTDDSGRLNPQFANPVRITGDRWNSIWNLLPPDARQHLGQSPKTGRKRKRRAKAVASARSHGIHNAQLHKMIGSTQRYGEDT